MHTIASREIELVYGTYEKKYSVKTRVTVTTLLCYIDRDKQALLEVHTTKTVTIVY